MSLETSLIDIDSLQIPQALPSIDPAVLEHSANKIAAVGDLIHIPIVRFLEIDSYELVSHFEEYQAFLKARELNPDIPDRIRVFITRKNSESAILEQAKALKQIQSAATNAESNQKSKNDSTPSNLKIELLNMKAAMDRLSSQIEVSNANQGDIQNKLSELVEAQPKPLPILEAFNQIDRPEIHSRLFVAIDKSSGFTSVEKKKIKKVIERVQSLKKQDPDLEFATFNGFLEKLGHEKAKRKVKGKVKEIKISYLTENILLKLIDQWPL